MDPYNLLQKIHDSSPQHVPAFSMVDYALGGLDDRLMSALYGEHISACEGCRSALEIHSGTRPQDLTRLTELPEFREVESHSERYELREQAKQRLVEFIQEASGALLIVGGEANPYVYCGEIEEALIRRSEAARFLGLQVPQVICGPAIGLGGDIRTPEQAILPKLAEKGLIRLYITEKRQKIHFRVNVAQRVYTEAYHQAGDPSPRTGVWYRGSSVARLFERRFQAILDSKQAQPYRSSRVAFVQMEAIEGIQKKCGNEFDELTADQIGKFLT